MAGIHHKNMIFVFNFVSVNTSIFHIPLAIIFLSSSSIDMHTHACEQMFSSTFGRRFSALYTSHLPCHAYWLNDSACWKVLGEILILKWKPSHLLMPVSLWSECAIQANGSGQKQPSWVGLTSYSESAELPLLLPGTYRQTSPSIKLQCARNFWK